MDSQHSNSTESPPSPSGAPPPPDKKPEDQQPSTSPPPPDVSSQPPPPQPTNTPPPPSPPTNVQPPPSPPTTPPDPPQPPKPPETTSPSPPKPSETSPSPPSTDVPTPSQPQHTPSTQTPENVPPSPTPPSQTPPQSPPGAKTITPPAIPSPGQQSDQPENPSPPNDSNPSGSPPSPSSSGSPSPPGGQLPPNPLILSPPPPSLTPAHSSSNYVSGRSKSNGGAIDTTGLVAIGLVSGFLLLGVIGFTVWCFFYRKKKVKGEVSPEIPPALDSGQSGAEMTPFKYALLKQRISPANASREFVYDSPSETPGMSKTLYSYNELATATNKFSERNLLGEGGFGSVFKGLLPDGREVAVKQLKDGGGQGEREFRTEVDTISRVHHRHLVSLVGYCISDEKRLLVYDYVPNNTLYFHLHGTAVLDWPMRIKIATGAARGIAYLHEDCHPRIIHRDIKSSNILLDNHFEAQVSDFGLAKLFSDLNTHVTTRVMGTFGYMAPEYASSGKLTAKSDVFSFGVVLLELITGRKPLDKSRPTGEESLVEWARPLLKYALDKADFGKLVDPRLRKNYVESEMFLLVEVASACVRYSALKRPKMTQILRAFDNILLSELANGIGGGESVIDAAEESAQMRLFQRMAFGSQDYGSDFFTQGYLESEED